MRNFARGNSSQQQRDRPREALSCFNCGESFPHSGKCPAFDIICNKCNKPGHLAKFCEERQKRFTNRRDKARPAARQFNNRQTGHAANARTVNAENIEQPPNGNPAPGQNPESVEVWRYVSTIKLRVLQDPKAGPLEHSPLVDVIIFGDTFKHLADTGAQVNIMSSETFEALKHRPTLSPAQHKLMVWAALSLTRSL